MSGTTHPAQLVAEPDAPVVRFRLLRPGPGPGIQSGREFSGDLSEYSRSARASSTGSVPSVPAQIRIDWPIMLPVPSSM